SHVKRASTSARVGSILATANKGSEFSVRTRIGRMPRARANGIDIEYEPIGNPHAAPMLLVTGLGAQLITWDDDFCAQLAGRGFHVIRFDNRDAGLSTHMDGAGAQ